jgi:hypothetical protein
LDKSKAAYWDGRNDSEEEWQVESTTYSISAGDFSAIRKMIVKNRLGMGSRAKAALKVSFAVFAIAPVVWNRPHIQNVLPQ